MSILNKKINKQLAAQYDLNYTDLRIDDLFLTKYDAAIPPKHMLGPHKYVNSACCTMCDMLWLTGIRAYGALLLR
jgi:hypothetical protein